MNFKRHHNKMQFVLIACYLANFLDRIQAQHVDDDARAFVKPNIDYSPWSPVDIIDYPLEIKISKVRSILSSPPETANINRNNKFSPANLKTATRRNFESASNGEIESPPSSSIRPTYRRKIFSTSTSSPSSTIKTENAAGRFRVNRRPIESHQGASTTAKPRRQFTPRTTSENVVAATTPENSSSTTTRVTFKKPTRGTYRPKTTSKSNANDDGNDGENYPEHFKALLKNKEVITQQNDKSVLKKPSKVFRPTSADKPTKVPVKTKPNAALYSPRPRQLKSTTILSTEASTTEAVITKRPSLRTRPPYRPTERAKLNFGSTLQEPPTAKTTPTYTTRAQVKQIVEEESMNVNTQITDDAVKQIDPPINEQYFPRTSAIGSSAGLRFSSRFRNSDVTLKPGYQPTVPIVTTTPGPGLDLNEIDLERWREILPLAAELIHDDAEIMTQSPSQTVSIYEALAEILSKPTESLNLFNNKSTDRTLISEAPISSTTSSTTTTTSTSTEKFDDTKENSGIIIDLLQKYQNETDSLVKSPNIFSLAKKGHHGESQNDTEINQLNEQHEATQRPSTSKLPSTHSSVGLNSVSIFPNGYDTTSMRPETTKDSFENEIGLDDFDFKLPTTKFTTRISTSVSSSTRSLPVTAKSTPSTTQRPTTSIKTTSQPKISSTTSFIRSTTQNFIDNNFKKLQDLLSKQTEATTTQRETTTQDITTTEIPTTTQNIINKNFQALQELLSKQTKPTAFTRNQVTTTTQIPTTQNFIDKNAKILQELLSKSQTKFETTTVPTTQNYVDRNAKILQELLLNQTKPTAFSRPSTTGVPKTTRKFIDENAKILQELLSKSYTTTDGPQTTRNYVDRNAKILQELLLNQTKPTAFSRPLPRSTTEIPETTTNFIDENAKILQELLSKNRATPFSRSTTVNQATTTEIATTTEFEELVLSTLGFSSSTTKPTSSIQKIRRPSMQTRFTTVSFKPSSTTQRVTTTEKVTTELPTTTEKTLPRTPSSTIRIIPSTTQMPTVKTSTFATPSSTHRFVPIMIPYDFSTTLFTSTTKKKSPFSDSEDLEFLRQLSSFVNRGVPTTPMTPRRTTSSTTTTTTEKTTTKKLPTTFSDSEDLAFLNSLRNYAGFINLTTERSNLANKILELAVNRMSKSVGDSKSSSNNNLESIRPAPFATTQSPEIVMNKIMDMKENINLMSSVILENQKANPQMRLSALEVEKTKKMLQKDVMQYNNDIQLLSLLIGRPLNAQDLEKLAKTNLGKASTKAPLTSTPKLTTTTTRMTSPTMRQTTSSSSTVPAFKSLSLDEVKFLQALQQIQTTLPVSTTTTQSPIQTRSRSQEAIIAALLKQQGIGPSINGNNQVQLDKILDQLSTDRSNRGISDFTSTIRPFSPMPPLSRQPRPIVDGLAWLWRQWQETAPGFQAPRQRPQVQVQQQQSLSFDDEFENDQESSGNSGGGLVFPNSQPLGPNGLIGAAIGVTRAVTQFLGVAFQGAGRFLTAALTTGSAASNIQGFGDSRL